MVAKADLEIYQGDTYSAAIAVSNPDGTPANLTGYTAAAQLRRGPADSDPVIVANFSTAVVSPNITISLPSWQTADLSGSYLWDLQITSPGPGLATTTILTGRAKVTPEVTRPLAVGLFEAELQEARRRG